jgi:hypothetical protein
MLTVVWWYNFEHFLHLGSLGFKRQLFLKQGCYIKNKKYYTQECRIKRIKEAKIYSRKAFKYEKKLIEIVLQVVQSRSQ